MYVALPDDIWPQIDYDRRHPDRRIFEGLPPPNGIYIAAWIRQFVRGHHDLPIFWPSSRWLLDHHEISRTNQHYIAPPRPMQALDLRFAPHAVRLLKVRGEADGVAPGVILRRLLVQHFGRRPADPGLVTGGPHVITPGEGLTCPTCAV